MFGFATNRKMQRINIRRKKLKPLLFIGLLLCLGTLLYIFHISGNTDLSALLDNGTYNVLVDNDASDSQVGHQLFNGHITLMEVKKAVEKIECGKACGLGQIPSDILIKIVVVVRQIHHMQETVFSATKITDILSLEKPETVRFKSVTTNSNDAYRPRDGHFVAPVDGSYIFMSRICSYITESFQVSTFYLSITVNETVRGTSQVDHNLPFKITCSQVSTVEVMRKGEHAYVVVYSLYPKSKLHLESANSFNASRVN